MYLRAKEPQKLLGLVENLLREAYLVSDGLMVRWVKQLKAGGHIAEAKEVLVAQSEMSLIRRKWIP